MKKLTPLLWLFAGQVANTQSQNGDPGSDLSAALTFEAEHLGSQPRGWGGGPPGTISVDGENVHGGRWSVRLERDANSAGRFSTITKSIPIDFTGSQIEWRGFLRVDNVSEFAGLWMRQDGDSPGLAFENMQQRQVKNTEGWVEFSITLPLHPNAKQLFFGVLIGGTGKAWADDLRLLVDGRPIELATKVERPRTPLDFDNEFNAGSRIAISALTPVQIENLALLARVWGFLKYHHPDVTSGKLHWDYELFRIIPKVLAARDGATATSTLSTWIRGLGDVRTCTRCMTLSPDELHLSPSLDWIDDERALGRELATLLRSIHRNRTGGQQFYVAMTPGVGNPIFQHEPDYPKATFPDAGYQLLALFRFWNIVEYWYPNRDILDRDWNDVLIEFIPRFARANDKSQYERELVELIGAITDTHANLWSLPQQSRPPVGSCQLPVIVRFIEDQAVVTGYSDNVAGAATGLTAGDVIETLDDVPVRDLVKRWAPYYPASNEAARLRDIARGVTRGECSDVRLGVNRNGRPVPITAGRLPLTGNQTAGATHDRPGDTFQLLSSDVAYLKLSSIAVKDVVGYVERAKGTKGLVIDIRNYPSEFVVFALGSLLVDGATPFARFTIGDLDNPGAFRWTPPLTLDPRTPHYPGRVVVLVDETSLSQAEYTSMAFRAAGARVVGSTTAGADGNVSPIRSSRRSSNNDQWHWRVLP
jgi:Peptidase family S41